ncbi:hypothetical protein FOG50_03477 [Hanseniaspora uvarum]|nr:hypothetical protein FOG50_03477 [Hanseniaspora uvarum]
MFKNTLFAYNACRQWSMRSFANPRIHKTNGMWRMYGSMRINSHARLTYSTKTTESNKNKEGKNSEGKSTDKGNFREEAKRLFKLLRPEYKWISFAVFCLILQSTSSMFVPKLTGDLLDLSNTYILKNNSSEEGEKALNYTESGRMKFELWGLSETQFFTVVGSVLVVGCLSNALRLIILRTTGERIIARLRTRLLNRIFEQDSKFWDVNKTGDILSRLNSDCVVVSRSLTNNISDGARSLFQGGIGIFMMLTISTELAGSIILFLTPAVVISRFLGKRAKTISKKVQEKIGEILKINEYQLNNQNLIRNYSAERVELVRYSDSIRNFYKASLKDVMNSALAQSTNQILGTTSLVACLLIGTNMVQQGHLTAGELSSFAMYAIYSASAFAGLFNFYNEINKGIGSYSRVIEIYDEKPSISPYKGKKDIYKAIENYNHNNVNNQTPIVEFQDVKFSYPTRKEVAIFNHLNFKINKGENICIVGSSGKGKSSLLHLLFRTYDIENGTIKVYNEDIKNFSLRKYRRHVGVVPQEPPLISGSILDNITYALTDSSSKKRKFTEEELAAAIEKANCTDFINSFPEGLKTRVSNKSGLSVGQKQRLALARQFLNNPDILFLDESTSALDGVSENIVVSNIQKRSSLEGKTTISIAHRKSTIKFASRIIVLGDDGKVAETGSYEELVAKKDSKLNDLLAHNMNNL